MYNGMKLEIGILSDTKALVLALHHGIYLVRSLSHFPLHGICAAQTMVIGRTVHEVASSSKLSKGVV
jgi:hypothetical protein